MEERIKRDSLPIWSPLLLIPSEKGLRARFSFILETLFPRLEILRQIFPDSAERKVWELYLKRIVQLLGFIKVSLKRRKESNL